MLSADTNLFLYAANPASPRNAAAAEFFDSTLNGTTPFATCELVLIEIYMQLRNPAALATPMSGEAAVAFCDQLRANPRWQHVDYEPAVSSRLWAWARSTTSGFRQVIDARLALTLRHHGVTEFATANTKHFAGFGFERVFDPTDSAH